MFKKAKPMYVFSENHSPVIIAKLSRQSTGGSRSQLLSTPPQQNLLHRNER